VRSGELRVARFDGRNVWPVREDLLAYIDATYEKTAERIASVNPGRRYCFGGLAPAPEQTEGRK
jgi:hypothetical protein